MKNLIAGTFILATLMVGCGDGDVKNNVTPDDNVKALEKNTETHFEYPDFFKNYAGFKGLSELNNGASLPYVATDGLQLHTIKVLSRSIGTTFGFTLKSVDEHTELSRAMCEKGNLAVSHYTYDIYNAENISGDFEMSNFSGPMLQLEGDVPAQCPDSYYDGAMAYNFEGNSSQSTFGKLGKPFFYNGSNANFDSADAYLGTLVSEDAYTFTINNSFTSFTVHTDYTVNDYKKAPYKKSSLLIYKNLTYSQTTSGDERTINANYTRQWQEYGETFKLDTKVSNVLIGADKTIQSGSATYTLSVIGKSERYIKAEVNYGANVKVLYNKEGVISKNF